MGNALWPIQDALYDRLVAHASLNGKVFDEVPENQALPYVAIGEVQETAKPTFGRDGSEAVLTIHIWSEAQGFKEALTLLDVVKTQLDNHALSVTGWSTVYLNFAGADTVTQDRFRQVVARFRIHVEEGS